VPRVVVPIERNFRRPLQKAGRVEHVGTIVTADEFSFKTADFAKILVPVRPHLDLGRPRQRWCVEVGLKPRRHKFIFCLDCTFSTRAFVGADGAVLKM